MADGVRGADGVRAAGSLRAADGVRVTVETVLLGHVGPFLTYRSARAPLRDDHPDALARAVAGFDPASPTAGALLHSTSWRFEPGGVVLTYAALPDPHPAAACRLNPRTAVARSDDQFAPSPAVVGLDNVAVHACRHLAWLRRTDPLVAAQADRLPELWALIEDHRPLAAGMLPALA
ncbi:hypothetical protein Raf01_66330 [Rugosimonospora africana]|uniref:Uncharacterized protein n=1 Tax=Rugosimonospora africana TaxID=556532 RepID=A0A8J3VU81_9ACTN|nr:hypothetical protein Raf01_66330 [Rugosimonospora africana]